MGSSYPRLQLVAAEGGPAQCYVERGDRLFLRTHNSVPSVRVQLRLRFMDISDGRVREMLYEQSPSSTARAVQTTVFDLAEGYILSATVVTANATVRRGQLWAQAGIVRGGELADQLVQVLVADYLTDNGIIGYPYGPIRSSVEGPGIIRSITGTNPAAGLEISETVPTNARWNLLAFSAVLVTSAAVANRQVNLIVDDGANTVYDFPSASVQAASLTHRYNAAPAAPAPVVTNLRHLIPLPRPTTLFQGFRLRTSTTLIDPADDWGAPQLLVEEWIED